MAQAERSTCPKCRKRVQFVLVNGKRDRKFQCRDCEGDDPLYSPEIAKLFKDGSVPDRWAMQK